jgi:hypothetical protein
VSPFVEDVDDMTANSAGRSRDRNFLLCFHKCSFVFVVVMTTNGSCRRGQHGLRRAYPPATLERLAEVKRQYDPDNLFRLNLNVPPALKRLSPPRFQLR